MQDTPRGRTAPECGLRTSCGRDSTADQQHGRDARVNHRRDADATGHYNQVVKRRRWLLTGFALAFLATCVGTWIWSSPPETPYAFLKGAELRYIRVNSESGWVVCTTSYFVDGTFQAIQERAANELHGWSQTPSMMDSIELSQGSRRVTVVGYEFGTSARPQTHVLVERPAVASDYPRSWISTVQGLFP